jgi:hypothetical protein
MNSKQFRIGLGLIVTLIAVSVLSLCFRNCGRPSEPVFKEVTFDASAFAEPTSEEPAFEATATERLAYVTDKGIYVVSPDGSGRQLLARSRGGSGFTHVGWSPDGTQIAYNAGDLMWGDADLYVLNADGTNEHFLTEVRPNAGWDWSPDSQSVYISRTSTMGTVWYALVQVETGRSLCEDDYDPMTGEKPACAPFELSDGNWWSGYGATVVKENHKWALAPKFASATVYRGVISPNEEWVAFDAHNGANSQYSWYIARSDGSEVRLLHTRAATERFCFNAAWSNDSRHLAFSTYNDGQASLWVASPDDGSMSLITRFKEDGCPEHLKWSTNKRHIGFSISGQWRQRYMVTLPGRQLSPMPPDEVFPVCQWSPDGSWLGCIGIRSIAVYRVSDGERFNVARVNSPGLSIAEERLAWSPTGRWFAVSAHTGMYSFDTVTRKVNQVTSQEVRGFTWSPCGSETR